MQDVDKNFQYIETLQRAVRFWIWRRAKPPFTRYEESFEELKK